MADPRLPLRVLVVDDEPIARQGLIALLRKEPDMALAGECRDGASAVEAIRSLRPDLVLLDVQMPELDGFDVVRALARDELPGIIFVTAYDRYAIAAFDVHAVDYVLKPVRDDRFHTALERARRRLRSERQEDLAGRIERLLAEREASAGRRDRLLVRTGSRAYFVAVGEIDWIEASGNYARLHTGSEVHPIRQTMKDVETQLPRTFVRIHRSAIVNLDRIKEIRVLASGDATVLLSSGAALTLSRSYRTAFEERAGKAR